MSLGSLSTSLYSITWTFRFEEDNSVSSLPVLILIYLFRNFTLHKLHISADPEHAMYNMGVGEHELTEIITYHWGPRDQATS